MVVITSLRSLLVKATTVLLGLQATAVLASPAVTYNNTLIEQRADPHITKHTDGWYYFTATVPAFDRIILRRAQSIQALSSAAETTIWRRKSSGVGSGQVWAPELHYINGKWYIYVALGVANEWRIRAFVLEGTGANPLTASWVERGLVQTNWDTFSLDMSTFVVNNTRYLVWAQQEPSRPDENSSLMLAPMGANPWSIRGPAVAISRPDRSWERIGYKVNEGASVVQRNGNIFLTYSASATDSNYCMGLLTASASADLMNPASWQKSANPVFVSNAATSQYGPGHNSFTTSEDGQSDVMVFHDRGYKDINGDPLNDPNRRTRVQKLYWKPDGTPDFGIPVPDGNTPARLRVHALEGTFLRYYSGSGNGNAAPSLPDTQFKIVRPGLSGEQGTVSLESTSNPGVYLRVPADANQQRLVFERQNGDVAAFRRAASFYQRSGLVGEAGAGALSLEASGSAGRFVGVESGGFPVLMASGGGDVGQQGRATFYLE